MMSSFAELGVPADLVAALEREGITTPFEVQRATIPDALAGRDVLGQAPTGSGKTLAFGLPLLTHLSAGQPRRPRGLILSPTRELAEQIRRELEPLAAARNLTALTIYGGVGFTAQIEGLSRGVDLIVACPGRLLDLLEQGEVSLSDVDQVVVDEADRMADMGFLPAVRELLDLTSNQRQTVLFSATLDHDVQVLIDHYQNDPVAHQVGDVEPDLTLVTHRFIATRAQDKLAIAADVIDDIGPTIVFCRTRHGVDRVARQLKAAGVRAGWIHGGRSQSQRDAALHAFTTGKVAALVATDVAARGIHVDGVACVIHYDPPADAKDYVHRSGRTARAGADGVVVSFVNADQLKAARRMMTDVGLPEIQVEEAPPTSARADHIEMDVRSRRTGKPLARPASSKSAASKAVSSKAVSSESPASDIPPSQIERSTGGPVKMSDDQEWSSSSSRSGRTRRAVGRSSGRDRTASSSDEAPAPEKTSPKKTSATKKTSTKKKARSGPADGAKPARGKGARGAKPGRGAGAKKQTATKSKRSGKPRPKNKTRSKKSAKRSR